MARPSTIPAQPPTAWTTRPPISSPMEGASAASRLPVTNTPSPASNRPSAESVGQRTIDQLAAGDSRQIQRQRKLHRTVIGMKDADQSGKRRQKDVQRQWPDGGDRDQNGDRRRPYGGG